VKKYYLLAKLNKIVKFCWIPSHIGISGNTKADRAAKDALKYNIALFQLPYTGLKYLIKGLLNGHLDSP
jgi:ribonuclease HI